MIGKIRRLRLRKKLTISEIAKVTGISRPTVRKWLSADVVSPPHYERVNSQTKLSAFKQTLEQALRADSHRPKHARRTGKDLYKQAQAQGYRGSYSRVTDFIREWRQEAVKDPAKAFVPLTFELGEAFQFDWSEEGLVVGGVYYRLQVSHLKLCASRAFWLVAYPSQGHEMLFDAHTRPLFGEQFIKASTRHWLVFFKPERLRGPARPSAHVQTRDPKTVSASSVVVGIDMTKAHVDVWVLGAKFDAQRFDKQAEAQSALTTALKLLDVALVVQAISCSPRSKRRSPCPRSP